MNLSQVGVEWDLDDLAEEVWQAAERAGWHDRPTSDLDRVGLNIALIHSEVTEALEAYRKHGVDEWLGDDGKPEGIGSEFADILIRTLELAHVLDIDIHRCTMEKIRYNERRSDVPSRGDKEKRF